MKCEFVVGQKVIRIRNNPWGLAEWHFNWQAALYFMWPPCHPALNDVCEILEIYPERDRIYLLFKGYRNLYCHRSFRPLIERKTDISVFETLLADLNAGKPVRIPA